jgi:hypothetical protein
MKVRRQFRNSVIIVVLVLTLGTVIERGDSASKGHRLQASLGGGAGGGASAGRGLHRSGVMVPAGGGEKVTCNKEITPSQTKAEQESPIKEAAGGETVCLANGTYTNALAMQGGKGESGRSSYVTIRPAQGATVTLTGEVKLTHTSYERWEHIKFEAPFNLHDINTAVAVHNIELLYDTWEKASTLTCKPPEAACAMAGVGIQGGIPSEGGTYAKAVVMEHDYFYRMEIEGASETEQAKGECKTGDGGQAVEVGLAEGITFKHNTVNEVGFHYIQGGSVGPEGMTVENNLFVGGKRWNCEHLNIWQIYGHPTYESAENNIFRNNIAVGRGAESEGTEGPFVNKEVAVNWIQWENGAGAAECGVTFTGSTLENNLAIYANNAELWTSKGTTVAHNTLLGGNTAISEEGGAPCGESENYTLTNNLVAGAPGFGWGTVKGTLTVSYNVSENSSAKGTGATHYIEKWKPEWKTSCPYNEAGRWNPYKEIEEGNHFPKLPAEYCQPAPKLVEELGAGVGYEGAIGP